MAASERRVPIAGGGYLCYGADGTSPVPEKVSTIVYQSGDSDVSCDSLNKETGNCNKAPGSKCRIEVLLNSDVLAISQQEIGQTQIVRFETAAGLLVFDARFNGVIKSPGKPGPFIMQSSQAKFLKRFCDSPGVIVSIPDLYSVLHPDTLYQRQKHESVVNAQVSRLRSALGDSREEGKPKIIETVYGQGYRLTRPGDSF